MPESPDHAVKKSLDALTRQSVGFFLKINAMAMLVLAWVDRFLVLPGDPAEWLVIRLVTVVCLLGLFAAMSLTKHDTCTKAFAYAGTLTLVAGIMALNIRFVALPSPHYTSIILVFAALCALIWDARHTFVVGVASAAIWLSVNFVGRSPFDAEAFSIHISYMGLGLFVAVVVSHVRHRLVLRNLLQSRALTKAVAERELLARQTAHDIRSPLAAMQVIWASPALCEEEKLLLREAMGRVNDIANNLVSHHGGALGDVDKSTKATHISPLLHSLISEKRSAFRAAGISFALHEEQDAAAAFVVLNAVALSRSLSNLLNNAAESMTSCGCVCVTLRVSESHVHVAIEDQGHGISDENIEKVLRGGVSIGKAQGSGLGVASAAAAVRQWGGTLDIQSQVGQGTTVLLTLPRAKPADWFGTQITIPEGGHVFVIDDDASMGRLWLRRLQQELRIDPARISVFSLLPEFVDAVRNCQSDFVCLVDIELLGTPYSGVDAVTQAQCFKQTIFVTSHHDDDALQKTCLLQGSKIMPKAFAARAPLVIVNAL